MDQAHLLYLRRVVSTRNGNQVTFTGQAHFANDVYRFDEAQLRVANLNLRDRVLVEATVYYTRTIVKGTNMENCLLLKFSSPHNSRGDDYEIYRLDLNWRKFRSFVSYRRFLNQPPVVAPVIAPVPVAAPAPPVPMIAIPAPIVPGPIVPAAAAMPTNNDDDSSVSGDEAPRAVSPADK